MRKAKGCPISGIGSPARASGRLPGRAIPIPITTIEMRMPPNKVYEKWVAAFHKGGMAANVRTRLNTCLSSSFVLIELLIVITVIALLLAILLPAVQRIRRQAKSIACQANLHQWGLMLSMYTGANDGKFFTMTGGPSRYGLAMEDQRHQGCRQRAGFPRLRLARLASARPGQTPGGRKLSAPHPVRLGCTIQRDAVFLYRPPRSSRQQRVYGWFR